jgi:DNA-binding LytR/AlgR family response regulator
MKTYQQRGNNSLLIINQKTLKKVLLENVVLLQGNVNYTIFYLEFGKERIVAHPIKFFEHYLEKHGFLRVHRSYMINLNHVKDYNPAEYLLTMSNGKKATISRRKKSIFEKFSSVV